PPPPPPLPAPHRQWDPTPRSRGPPATRLQCRLSVMSVAFAKPPGPTIAGSNRSATVRPSDRLTVRPSLLQSHRRPRPRRPRSPVIPFEPILRPLSALELPHLALGLLQLLAVDAVVAHQAGAPIAPGPHHPDHHGPRPRPPH